MSQHQVTITVSGKVGSGKSALCGEIEILCKALGLEGEWLGGQEEKNLTHADWTEALEMYKPKVRIIEANAQSAEQDRIDALRYRWIATLQDWSDIERMCWSSVADSAAQFKADLDKYIDAAIAGASK